MVAEELGLGRTQQIATHLEYNWDTEGKYVRAKLADKYLQGIGSILSQFSPKTVLYKGDETRWKSQIQIASTVSEGKIYELIGFHIMESTQGERAGKNIYSIGKNWLVTVKIDKQAGNKKLVSLEVFSKPNSKK